MRHSREPVGRRLRRLRSERGLTQRTLAQPHYTAAYVSSVESGTRTPSGDALRHFADRLGIDADELLGGHSPRDVVQLDLSLVEAAQEFMAGRPEPAVTQLEQIVRQAEALGQSRQAGLALLWLATVESHLGDNEARTRHVAAAESALSGDTLPYRALLAHIRATILTEWGEPHYALYLLQTSHDELMREGYPQPMVLLTLRAHLADGHLRLGNIERAGAHASDALRLARLGLGDKAVLTELITQYTVLCRTQLEAERYADAAVAVAHAHDLLHEQALRPAIARCLLARGRVRRLAGDHRAALADLVAAREMTTADDDLAIAIELAEVNRELGHLGVAESLLDDVLRAVSDEDPLTAAVRYQFGALALARNDLPAAEAHFRDAIALAIRLDARDALVRSLDRAGTLLSDQGRLDEAATLLRSGLLALGAATD